MTKKKEVEYTELDIIMQASADAKSEIAVIADQLIEKYEGGIAKEAAITAAKEHYFLGVLPMRFDPKIRVEAEKKVKKYYIDRAARLKAKDAPKKVEK